MSTAKTKIIGLTVTLLCAGIVISCGGQQQAEQEDRLISVEGQVVSLSNLDLAETFTGSLEGEKQAVIYAKLAEAVEKVHVAEGQSVKANDVLISLDKYGPSSQYNAAVSQYRNSEKNYEKMSYLYKEGAVSESQYDAAKTEYEVNKAAFDAVSKMVDVQSPIAGVVTAVNVSEGEYANVGQKLVTVATTGRLRVKFGVNAEQVGYFSNGAEVYITSDMTDTTASGNVVAVAGSADPMTRAFEIEAVVNNSAGKFSPGMFVRVHLVRKRLSDVITVPRSAVVVLEGHPSVFVLENGRARQRQVTLGNEISGTVVVTSGLSVGDTIVTLGQNYIVDDTPVNVTVLNGR